jgi:hypothetical protein
VFESTTDLWILLLTWYHFIQIQTATQTRIDLEALSRPIPVSDLSSQLLIPDEARWEVMSAGDRSSTVFSPASNIRTWRQAVDEQSTNPDPHLQPNGKSQRSLSFLMLNILRYWHFSANGQNGNDERPVVVPISVRKSTYFIITKDHRI